ncbi:major facilitator superfamily MFS-1, partial [Canariomyces notabilis]
LCMCLFLTNVEIPIVTTALVSITDEFGGFDKASWVISAYLLGYVGVLIILSKLSDIFGRKSVLLAVILVFTIFSGACGAAQSIEQLIVFRGFQGIGGAGNYAISSVIFLELVPSHKYAKYTSSISVVYSLSLLCGPLLGGAISEYSSWRWIFLINVPAALPTALLLVFTLPSGFPRHHLPPHARATRHYGFSRDALRRLDGPGTVLLLLGTMALVAALEEAGVHFPWRSAPVIVLLVVAGLAWAAFLFWERRVTLRQGKGSKVEPVFPWRFVQNRVWIGMVLNALFLGAPWFCAMFQLPQRLQIVNGMSPVDAAVRVIPFSLAAPLGSVVAPTIAKVGRVPPLYLVLAAAVVQVVGFALLSTLPDGAPVLAAQYGYEIIAGFGCGVNITLLVLMTPFCVQERDKAVAMGAVAQFRVMGGAIGLAIVTTAFNGLVRGRLGDQLAPGQLEQLLQFPGNIASLPPSVQEAIRVAFADGYALQAKILCGLAAGQIPASFLMWQTKQILV